MSDAQTTGPVHVRTIRVEITPVGERELDITATLVDEHPRGNSKWFGSEPPPVIHDMRLGIRVPFYVVSPYVKRHYVSHIVLDHTSLLRFVKRRYAAWPRYGRTLTGGWSPSARQARPRWSAKSPRSPRSP